MLSDTPTRAIWMNPQAAELQSKHHEAEQLLHQGMIPNDVAGRVGLSTRAIYNLARRQNLPTNPSIQEGGRVEGQIVYMYLAGYETNVIGRRFKLAVPCVQSVIDRARDRVREEWMDDPS